MSVKHEVESAAIAAIPCPYCKAAAGNYCRQRRHKYGAVGPMVRTHQRRLSAFIASDAVKWGETRKATTK